MVGKAWLGALLFTAVTSATSVYALADRGHQANWTKQQAAIDLPDDWRKRLVVGKPLEQPLFDRAELIYQNAEQRVVTLRLAEVLVHVRKQDKHVIAVTNSL